MSPALTAFNVSSVVISQLETVTVSFQVAADATRDELADDWIAVYCRSDQQLQSDEAIDWRDFLDSRGTDGKHAANMTFGPLVNMRCSLQFAYMTRDWQVVAMAPLVRFRDGATEPAQVRLAMADLPSQMQVAWTSASVAPSTPRVKYGRQKDHLALYASAVGETYDADDMCMAPATTRSARLFRDPGVQYNAVMTQLEPGQTYYYQVGAENASWSEPRAFVVPPAAGTIIDSADTNSTSTSAMSLFVLGDLMTPTTATRDFRIRESCGTTMALIQADLERGDRDYRALFHVGDLSYARGSTFIWDHFGALLEPVASRVPYMISMGNHEYGFLEGKDRPELHRYAKHPIFLADGTHGYDAHGECGVPAEKRFHAPANGNGIWWYSTELGLTHHIVLSSEHAFERGAPMREWLERDLAKVDRTKTPWLFVHLHRSLYCSVAYRGDFMRSLMFRDELEPLFAQHHVDIVFTGHYHSYERSCPVYDDACLYGADGDAQAPIHIMVGSGGANVDTYGYYSVGWSEFARMTYGYGRLHVFNASHALFEFVQNDQERVVDSKWIVSNHAWPTPRWRWRRYLFHWDLAQSLTVGLVVVLLVMWVRLWRKLRRPRVVHSRLKTSEAEEEEDKPLQNVTATAIRVEIDKLQAGDVNDDEATEQVSLVGANPSTHHSRH